MIDTKGGRIEGSRWTVRGVLKYPVKVKASLLWGECSLMYEVSLKPVDFEM